MKTLRWDAVYGQRAAVATLQGALSRGRIGHAYLFSGPPGVGRRLTASVFAAALVCEAGDGAVRPCGTCQGCQLAARGLHPDVYRLQPEEDKILIDQVRSLQQRAALTAVRGRYKVFIVESMEAATEQAQNALLKVLEEPTGNAVFVLIGNDAAPPLPTIVSRCLTVRFDRLSREDATRVLGEAFGYGDLAPLAAAWGDGSIELARHVDGEALLQRRERARALLRDVLGQSPAAAAVHTEVWHKDRDELLRVLDFVEMILRDVLLGQHSPEALEKPEEWLFNFDLAQDVTHLIRRLPPADVLQALQAVVDFRRRLAQNIGVRSALTVLLLELAAVGRAVAS